MKVKLKRIINNLLLTFDLYLMDVIRNHIWMRMSRLGFFANVYNHANLFLVSLILQDYNTPVYAVSR